VTGASDNAWENSPWRIVTSKTSLDHASSIVTNKGLNVLTVSHLLLMMPEI